MSAQGCQPATHSSSEHAPVVDALKKEILAELDGMLLKKEEALWRRGQVEIRKMQQEYQQALGYVQAMQEQQTTLIADYKDMRTALWDVTSKFEVVVKEMRSVLHVLPPRDEGHAQSPSVASTSASDAVKDDRRSECTPGSSSLATEAAATGSVERRMHHEPTPDSTSAWHNRVESLLASPTLSGEGATRDSRPFCTPPRTMIPSKGAMVPGEYSVPLLGSQPGLAVSAPCALPLTSALQSPSVASIATNPSPAGKPLNLASCLEQQGSFHATPNSMHALMSSPLPSTPAGYYAAPSPAAPIHPSLSPAQHFDFINIELVKEPGFQTIGAEVADLDSTSLQVAHIDDFGLVGRYNASQHSDMTKMKAGDRVIEVNYIRYNAPLMLQEFRFSQRLRITLARASTMPVASSSLGQPKSFECVGTHAKDNSDDKSHSSGPLCSPQRQLRPDAAAFVPASQEKPLPCPPGFEGYAPGSGMSVPNFLPLIDQTFQEITPDLDDPEEVKRALFA